MQLIQSEKNKYISLSLSVQLTKFTCLTTKRKACEYINIPVIIRTYLISEQNMVYTTIPKQVDKKNE